MYALGGAASVHLPSFYTLPNYPPSLPSFHTHRTQLHTHTTNTNDDEDDEEYEWGGRFRLQWDKAPLRAEFPAALAERAFFLGACLFLFFFVCTD